METSPENDNAKAFLEELITLVNIYAPGTFQGNVKGVALTNMVLSSCFASVLVAVATHAPGDSTLNTTIIKSLFDKNVDVMIAKVGESLLKR